MQDLSLFFNYLRMSYLNEIIVFCLTHCCRFQYILYLFDAPSCSMEKADDPGSELITYLCAKPHWRNEEPLITYLCAKHHWRNEEPLITYLCAKPHWRNEEPLIRYLCAKPIGKRRNEEPLIRYLCAKPHWRNEEPLIIYFHL